MKARAVRSYAAVSDHDLVRLRDLALQRHAELVDKRADWCSQLLAACLVQGGARHRVHGDRGVKDFDVYLFYPLVNGADASQFPFNRTTKCRDFGDSDHGRQLFTDDDRNDPRIAARVPTWERFEGRRVDLLARAVPPADAAMAAVVSWLSAGGKGSSAWHLARTPVIALEPELGAVWWEGDDVDVAGIDKGAYEGGTGVDAVSYGRAR